MDKLTYYDELAECYKIKPDACTNFVQRLGALEHGVEYLKFRVMEYKLDCDSTASSEKCLACNETMFGSVIRMIEEILE